MIALSVIFCVEALISKPPGNASRIVVDRAQATVKRIEFDPTNPPADIPPLSGGEAALTRFDFECAIHVSYSFVESPTVDVQKTTHVVARLEHVNLTLSMDDTIYLPQNANIPLRSHEEGHHVIDERVYQSAEAAARTAAEEAMSKTWPGAGTDADAAGKAATDLAVKAIGDAYLAATSQWASRVSDDFDDITQHGTRPINVARAIDEAFDRDARRSRATMTTRPAR